MAEITITSQDIDRIQAGTYTVTTKGTDLFKGVSLEHFGALVNTDSKWLNYANSNHVIFRNNEISAVAVDGTYMGAGAGLCNYGNLKVKNLDFDGNAITVADGETASGYIYGGALANMTSTQNNSIMQLTSVTFTSNSAVSNNANVIGCGGAIANFAKANSSDKVFIDGATYTGNSADKGGAIYNGSTAMSLILKGTQTFNGNTATVAGGAIYNATGSTIDLQGTINLQTSTDTIVNDGTFAWNMGVVNNSNISAPVLNGMNLLTNNGTFQIIIDDTIKEGTYAIATGVEEDLATITDKNTFALTGVGNTTQTLTVDAAPVAYGTYIYTLYAIDTDSDATNNNANLWLTVTTGAIKQVESWTTYQVNSERTTWENGTGGALHIMPGATVKQDNSATKVVFQNNSVTGQEGGAIDNYGSLTLTNAEFNGNLVTRVEGSTLKGGGAIVNQTGATLNVSNSLFNGNRVNGVGSGDNHEGGAILNYGKATLDNCTFEGHQCDGTDGKMKGSVIFNNGALSTTNGVMTISNTTFTNNNVVYSNRNGLVNNANAGKIIFTDCEFIDNIGSLGICNSQSEVVFHGTNTFQGNTVGAIDTFGYSGGDYAPHGRVMFDGILNLGDGTPATIKDDNGEDVLKIQNGILFWDLSTEGHSATINGYDRVTNVNAAPTTVKTQTWNNNTYDVAQSNGLYIQLDAETAQEAAKYVLATNCGGSIDAKKQNYILTTGYVMNDSPNSKPYLYPYALQSGSVCLTVNGSNLAYQGGMARVVYDAEFDELQLWTNKTPAYLVNSGWEDGADVETEYKNVAYAGAVNDSKVLFDNVSGAITEAAVGDAVAFMGGSYKTADIYGQSRHLDFAGSDIEAGQVIGGKKNGASEADNRVAVSKDLTATALIGGDKFMSTYTKASALDRNGVNDAIVISGDGTVTTSFLVGGSFLYSVDGTGDTDYSISNSTSSINVEAGAAITARTVVGGSIVGGKSGDSNGLSDLTDSSTTNLVLNGGTYTKIFGAGYIQNSSEATLTKEGNVNITINGGSYTHIYGGIGASKISYLAQATMTGEVNITVNANSAISVTSIFGGNSGYGSDTKTTNATITFTGNGSNLTFDSTVGIISGGHATEDDDYKQSSENTSLVFAGFTGNFNALNVRDFNSISVVSGVGEDLLGNIVDVCSLVTFTKELDLSDVKVWNFEAGSALTWENGDNDFAEDTLNFNGFSSLEKDEYVEVFMGSADTLSGWDDSSTVVKFDGAAASFANSAWSTDKFSLSLDGNNLIVTRIA